MKPWGLGNVVGPLFVSVGLWIFQCVARAEPTPIREELFNTIEQVELKWSSSPLKSWDEVKLQFGHQTSYSVYQACNSAYKTTQKILWTTWIPRRDARHLFIDLLFAQEVESPSSLSPLNVHLVQSDTPVPNFKSREYSTQILELRVALPFQDDETIKDIQQKISQRQGLNLGRVSRVGFHLGFSYSGPCLFLGSVQVYFMKCPGFVEARVNFAAVVGESGLVTGACIQGSVEISPPQRHCQADGQWGALQGHCICAVGRQQSGESCEACTAGRYKPENGSAECLPCPPNSIAVRAAAEECSCLDGYFRVASDPADVGCTKPPSAPTNLRVCHLNGTTLELCWGPPADQGGRVEVWYSVECWEREGQSQGHWEACGGAVRLPPHSQRLRDTAVNITGVQLHHDYRLTVQAMNAVSVKSQLQGATKSITIDRWKADVTHTPGPQPLEDQSLPPWLLWAVIPTSLMLTALISSAACLIRHRYKLHRDQDQVLKLMPIHTGTTYRREEQNHQGPHQSNIQLQDEQTEQILRGLREVLVERSTLVLGKELGTGEFGSVYEGLFYPEQGPEIKVAVKTTKAGIYSKEDLESFLKEAELMKNFKHTNVVRLLGVALEQQDDSPVPMPMVILPFMKHGDLRRFLIATRYGDIPMFVPYQSLLRFMIDIAAGMEYLSYYGFLHRDLAARNCMLGDDLRVCVADFGLSKKICSSTYYRQKEAIRMPIKWMAIESIADNIFTTKSDVWSFGVTMWEIVTRGKMPYAAVHNHELLDLLESGRRLKPPDCDPKLYNVMLSCWRRDTTQRPCFTQLGEELRVMLSELSPLEASEEAHYINMGLQVAEQGHADEKNPECEEELATGNVYLPAPGACGPSVEDEEGYLMYMPEKN
uniref:receptor protein-tyrosine kinase n=1 Tax=Paramormyrops kingsleyae TaxID=1676925 RepID=A0A3B3T7J6_9TELE|nr:ephrin type-A receptor 8-like isoform X1 [Paramormyrops kingsleyae]